MTAKDKREALAEHYKKLAKKMTAARWGTKTKEERSAHARMMALARYAKKALDAS